jgi:hypothetical protein
MAVLMAACGMGAFAGFAGAQQPSTTWSTFGGTAIDNNYSALTRINRSNVDNSACKPSKLRRISHGFKHR